jgi:S1-C subfamily serine protease
MTLRRLLLPAVALALAVFFGPAGGQDDAPVDPTVAVSRVLPRVFSAAAPHLVTIRPAGETRAVRRRGRTGVVIRDGVVVTSATHIDVFGLDDLVVEDWKGRAVPASLAGRDLRLRIVVLSCPGLKAPPAPIAAARAPGSLVVALGAVLRQESAPTGTFGIVSAVDRFQGRADQIDAALDSANVGGGLFDLSGRLLGVLVEVDPRLGQRSGVGFSIPVALIDAALERLLAGDQLEQGTLGLRVPKVAGAGAKGVEIVGVSPAGPGSAAGLRAGDRITSLGGRPTPTLSAFRHASAYLWAGQEVEVEITRGDATRRLTLKLTPAR